MKGRLVTGMGVLLAQLCLIPALSAGETVNAVKLSYQEFERDIDPYKVSYTVSSDFLRIDDESDDSGYIVYDVRGNRIYSVSHYDQSILVIPEYKTGEFKPAFNVDIEYGVLEDAPEIGGKKVYAITGFDALLNSPEMRMVRAEAEQEAMSRHNKVDELLVGMGLGPATKKMFERYRDRAEQALDTRHNQHRDWESIPVLQQAITNFNRRIKYLSGLMA